jgi:hypothetical protein
MREARIEAAARSGVVVDLHGAQLARLEILSEALDPLFAELPPGLDLFDRGLNAGDPPRLWIDMLAHVAMAHDTRVYQFVQDTRYGRKVLAESAQVAPIVKAITQYVAHRLIERERALATASGGDMREAARTHRIGFWWGVGLFVCGMIVGATALMAFAWFAAPRFY